MPAGIIVYNDHGSVLIDANYANLGKRAKGTLTATGTAAQSSPESPVFALNGTGLAAVSDITNGVAGIVKAGTDTTTWYSFDRPTAVGTAGLQVFDATGKLVFDAANQYARVVDVFSGADQVAWSQSRTYTSGRTYAVATLKRARWTEEETRPDPVQPVGWYNYRRRFVFAGSQVSGATVTVAQVATAWGEWSGPLQVIPPLPAGDYSAQFAVIDVTGY